MESSLPGHFKCPICKKSVEKKQNSNYPFCSERCQWVDLGNWLKEGYRIEGDERVPQPGDGSED
jgi:endogenous inhibitor of DNA gyrase (YacG/DUF329 family)